MPKIIAPLTAAQVDQLTTTTAVGQVPGLILAIAPNGTRSWVLRYGTPRKNMGLGSYPLVTLKEARELATDALALYRKGTDPLAQRQEQKAAIAAVLDEAKNLRKTFDDVAEDYLEFKRPEWDEGGRSYAQWEQTIREYMRPVVGKLPVAEVTTQHVLKILEPIWQTKNETAKRTRHRMEKILAYAGAKGYRPQTAINPAQLENNLEFALPKVKNTSEGFATMAHEEISAFLAYLAKTSSVVGYNALCLTILTGVRTNNVMAATWGEIDWQGKIWNSLEEVTEAKGKKKPYRVPLTAQAMEVLKTIKAANEAEGLTTNDDDRIFRQLKTWIRTGRGTHGAPMSNAAMHALVKGYAGDTATVHGFRKSLRTWGEEKQFPTRVLEKILNHKLKDDDEGADSKLVDTYQKSDLLELRRPIMQEWADYVMPPQKQEQTA